MKFFLGKSFKWVILATKKSKTTSAQKKKKKKSLKQQGGCPYSLVSTGSRFSYWWDSASFHSTSL